MKKVLALVLIFSMVFCFYGCGKKKQEEPLNNTPVVTTESGIETKVTEAAIDDGPVKLNPEEDWQQIKAFFQQTEHTLFNCYRFEDPDKISIEYDGGCIGNLHLNDGSDIKPYKNQKVLENGLVFELCMAEDGNTRDSYIVVHPTETVGDVYVAFGGTQLVQNQETKKREAVEFAQNEFIYSDMESYINLSALKDNMRVMSYDIDDDSICESIALGDDIGVYDYVNGMVVSCWIMQSIPGSTFCNMCMHENGIKEEYVNCFSVQATEERASGVYSYSDGVFTRVCSIEESITTANTFKLTESDLPEIEALRADANDKLDKMFLGLDASMFIGQQISAPAESGLEYYFEVTQNELFNNKSELLSYLKGTFTEKFANQLISKGTGIVEYNGKLYYTSMGIGSRMDIDDLKHERFVQMESNGEIYYMEIMSYALLDMDKMGSSDNIEDYTIKREQVEFIIKYENGWKFDDYEDIYTGFPKN